MEVEPHQYWDYDQFWRDNFSRLLRLQNSFYDLQLTSCSSSSSSVMAHRAILSRVSSYLHNILKTAPEEQTTSLTEILVPGFSLQALQLFVQICYEGRVVEAVTNPNCQVTARFFFCFFFS